MAEKKKTTKGRPAVKRTASKPAVKRTAKPTVSKKADLEEKNAKKKTEEVIEKEEVVEELEEETPEVSEVSEEEDKVPDEIEKPETKEEEEEEEKPSAKEKKKEEEPKPLLWQKIGRGSLRMFGRIIKPGERFEAYPNEIPEAFRDVIRCLDEEGLKATINNPAAAAPPKPKEKLYKIAPSGVRGWFVVINIKSGKQASPTKLRKEAAMTLADTLNG